MSTDEEVEALKRLLTSRGFASGGPIRMPAGSILGIDRPPEIIISVSLYDRLRGLARQRAPR